MSVSPAHQTREVAPPARRCRRRAIGPGSPRPSELLTAFFLAGLAYAEPTAREGTARMLERGHGACRRRCAGRCHEPRRRGLRALASGGTPSGPPFMTLRGGLGELVEALWARLHAVDVRTSTTVARIERLADGRHRVALADGDAILADHVVVATPAFAAAKLLDAACPAVAQELRGIDYASVATVALAYAPGTVTLPPGASGLLVPPSQPRTITASTWSSAKWAHLGGGPC